MMRMILNKTQIRKRIEKDEMISEFIDIDNQLTSNGFDITIKKLSLYMGAGTIDFDNTNRELPRYLNLTTYYKYNLQYGIYLIDFNEYLKMPKDLVGIGYVRSTLLRCGVYVPSAIFDSGFCGYSQGMLIVNNNYGINIMKNARVMQLVFMTKKDDGSVYNGRWGEEVMMRKPPLLDDQESDMESLDILY